MPSHASRRAKPRSPLPTPEPLARRRVLATLADRFFIRCHVALIALWGLAIGMLASKLLWMAGIDTLPLRYGLATVAAYLGFLLGVRCWLIYVGLSSCLAQPRRNEAGNKNTSNVELPDISMPGFGGSGSAGGRAGPLPASGRGGTFDGGGASGNFTLDDAGPLSDAGGSAGEALEAAGDAGDALGLILLVLGLLAAAVLGAFYLVSQGPLLLAEVAFEALLAGGMVKVARRADQASWLLAALRRSILPALIVGALAVGLGFALEHWFPGKESLVQVLHRQ